MMFSITLGVVQPLRRVRFCQLTCAIKCHFLPVAPGPALDVLGVDVSADTEFILLDLDLLLLALCAVASSAVGRGGLCNGVS